MVKLCKDAGFKYMIESCGLWSPFVMMVIGDNQMLCDVIETMGPAR